MLTAVAGATTYDTLDAFDTGLVGTLGVRVRRLSDAALVVALTTSGITETAPSVYRAQFTAPANPGAHLVEWVLAGEIVQGGTTQLTVVADINAANPAAEELSVVVGSLRRLLGDPAAQRWTDQVLEHHLTAPGRWRKVWRAECEEVCGSRVTGTSAYLAYELPVGNLATDVEFYADVEMSVTVTPDRVDYRTGAVEFDSPGHTYPLYATYRTFDLYGAAADALEEWANGLMEDVDFSADGQRFDAGKRAEREMRRAAQYRRQSWGGGVSVVSMTRSDTR